MKLLLAITWAVLFSWSAWAETEYRAPVGFNSSGDIGIGTTMSPEMQRKYDIVEAEITLGCTCESPCYKYKEYLELDPKTFLAKGETRIPPKDGCPKGEAR